MLERRVIGVQGVVQGVGFRPYVHRLASAAGLRGNVRNDAAGVTIDVEGDPALLDDFLRTLTREPPPLARIEHVTVARALPRAPHDVASDRFTIAPSTHESERRATAEVPADVATCNACVAELFDAANRRYEHPFISCTQCGPRLTVVRDRPYDRERTTMAAFAMCDDCRREYDDPGDRRFHAESIACDSCGPVLRAVRSRGDTAASTGADALARANASLRAGEIVALKALGGYHLACDATSDRAVARLRVRKRREAKPLAIMVRDVPAARALCILSAMEQELLESSARPIVLLARRTDAITARSVAPGQATLGVMLPSTPVHHLLLAALDRPLVMTSGNRSDEPVATDEETAFTALGGISDLFLTHDRAIAVRCDDSVARVAAGDVRVVRRSRGYTPRAVPLTLAAPAPILALGAHLKNTICLAHDHEARLSPHVGDLDTLESRRGLRDAVRATIRFAGVEPRAIAHDLHPEYASTHLARELARELEVDQIIAVQHHHAHIAACTAEHGVTAPVIGVAFDGTGYGTDGAIWGGEFLVSRGASFERHGHLAYVSLPGGDAAARRPWRSAAAHAAHAGVELARPAAVAESEWSVVQQLLTRPDRQPVTSSVGRLFDAVASLLDERQLSRFEGEAPMALEAIADVRGGGAHVYPVRMEGEGTWTVNPAELIRGVLHDVARGLPAAEIAGAFHLTLRDMIVAGCERVREESSLTTVALSGGVFMNALLLGLTSEALSARGFTLLIPRLVPCNDGGIALGQAYVAAHALREGE